MPSIDASGWPSFKVKFVCRIKGCKNKKRNGRCGLSAHHIVDGRCQEFAEKAKH